MMTGEANGSEGEGGEGRRGGRKRRGGGVEGGTEERREAARGGGTGQGSTGQLQGPRGSRFGEQLGRTFGSETQTGETRERAAAPARPSSSMDEVPAHRLPLSSLLLASCRSFLQCPGSF